MRKVREVLRLRHERGLSYRQVARSVGLAHSTVREYVDRAERAGLMWPLPMELDDAALEVRLFPPPPAQGRARPQPDWAKVHRELSSYKGVTLQLLWLEYRENHPDGYGYSRFCDLYRAWRDRLDVVLRQPYRAGEKCFVDYAGPSVEVVDAETGELREAQVFVGVLAVSNYTFLDLTWSRSLSDWIAAHVRMFSFFGGVAELLIPDNEKSGVRQASRYEPDLNPTYAGRTGRGAGVRGDRPALPRHRGIAGRGSRGSRDPQRKGVR
ncbi:MAG: IS21 family transposase, partial [Gemmatimonadota bacterium]